MSQVLFIVAVKLIGHKKKVFLIYYLVDIKSEKIKYVQHELNGNMLYQHGNLDIKKNVGKKEDAKHV